MADATTEQVVGGRQEAVFGRDGAEDEVRVVGVGREVSAGRFDGRVGRLNGDLRRRQIAADEDVDVRNLAERGFHSCFHAFKCNTPDPECNPRTGVRDRIRQVVRGCQTRTSPLPGTAASPVYRRYAPRSAS